MDVCEAARVRALLCITTTTCLVGSAAVVTKLLGRHASLGTQAILRQHRDLQSWACCRVHEVPVYYNVDSSSISALSLWASDSANRGEGLRQASSASPECTQPSHQTWDGMGPFRLGIGPSGDNASGISRVRILVMLAGISHLTQHTQRLPLDHLAHNQSPRKHHISSATCSSYLHTGCRYTQLKYS